MTISPLKFTRRPFAVEAIQVTADNMKDVAEWCGGKLMAFPPSTIGDRSMQNYVKVPVVRPLNNTQTKARVGCWVLFSGNQFRVYTDESFKKCFQEIESLEQFDIKISQYGPPAVHL